MIDKADEIRILENFLYKMTKVYTQRAKNYLIVHDILLRGTSTAGMTSCCTKCRELGIDPYGYNLKDEE